MAKFSILRAPAWVYVVICLAIGGAVGFVTESSGFGQQPLTAAGVTAGLLLLIAPAVILYWRRLDEAAREAHKFAWYWGGNAGIVVVMVAFSVLMTPGAANFVEGEFAGQSPSELLAFGMISALMAQVVGYVIAWVGWWIARR